MLINASPVAAVKKFMGNVWGEDQTAEFLIVRKTELIAVDPKILEIFFPVLDSIAVVQLPWTAFESQNTFQSITVFICVRTVKHIHMLVAVKRTDLKKLQRFPQKPRFDIIQGKA